MAPGPELAAVLAAVDRSRVNGHDLVTVVEARARLVAHLQAELLADVAQVAHCPPGGPDAPVSRTPGVQEYAADEVGFALAWTRRAARSHLDLALDVVERLPRLYAAMAAGDLDLAKVRVIADAVAVVDDPTARAVVDQVVPVAPRLTTGALRVRLQRLVVSVDPDAARRRQERGVAGRRVVCEPNHDGTGIIVATGLPPGRAAAAFERVDALAKAAKVAGDGRPLDQLRVDVVLGLLEGTHTDSAAVARRGVVELTVPLTTLIGLSDHPGEVAGFGPVIADVARQIAADQPQAQWRFTVVDPHTGRTLHTGPVRRRPAKTTADQVIARDRTCRAPGCRAPASRAELDHTIDHARGGPTHPGNLGALCRHHHRVKHHGRHRLHQYTPGHFHWTTPLGHHYLKTPDPAQDPPLTVRRSMQ